MQLSRNEGTRTTNGLRGGGDWRGAEPSPTPTGAPGTVPGPPSVYGGTIGWVRGLVTFLLYTLYTDGLPPYRTYVHPAGYVAGGHRRGPYGLIGAGSGEGYLKAHSGIPLVDAV